MGVIGPIVHSGLGTGRALAMHLSLRIIARARTLETLRLLLRGFPPTAQAAA